MALFLKCFTDKIQALLFSCQKDTEDNVLTCSGANLNANVLTW